MNKLVCEPNLCVGCMACEDICPCGAVRVEDNIQSFSALIDSEKCIGCKLCEKVCPGRNNIEQVHPIFWKQGWTCNDDIRRKSSSGGAACAIASSFISNGGVVCSCEFKDGEFIFSLCDNISDIDKYSGSKYVKSNPEGMYKKIREVLKQGKKVLLIALPCQIAAAKLYIREASLSRHLYTIDLICHGTPSVKVLECFLNQHNQSLKNINNITFRRKGNFSLSENDMSFSGSNAMDSYTIGFLSSLFYTENCYHCKFADIRRVSDLTLGDSWGSELDDTEKMKGISLLLGMTEKANELVQNANMHFEFVDLDKAVLSNAQLQHHSQMPQKYYTTINKIKKGDSIDHLVFFAYPQKVLKQKMKRLIYSIYSISRKDCNKSIQMGGGIIHR